VGSEMCIRDRPDLLLRLLHDPARFIEHLIIAK
jgi:hypothetical protein